MSSLEPDALTVTSFETTGAGIQPSIDSDNCVSPLCVTEGNVCTTPGAGTPSR